MDKKRVRTEKDKEYDIKYNSKRNEKVLLVNFNMNIESEVELYNKFLELKENYNLTTNKLLKLLIEEKEMQKSK